MFLDIVISIVLILCVVFFFIATFVDPFVAFLNLWNVYKNKTEIKRDDLPIASPAVIIKGILVLLASPLLLFQVDQTATIIGQICIMLSILFCVLSFIKHYFWFSYGLIFVLQCALLCLSCFMASYLKDILSVPIINVFLLPLYFAFPIASFVLDTILFVEIKKNKKLSNSNQANESKINNQKPEIKIENKKGQKTSLEITPLLNAIIDKNVSLVEEILKTSPEQVNIFYAENGNTPLHVAALKGHIEIVRLLLEQPNIDTAILNKEQKTAFNLATERGYADISALLKN